MANVLHFLAGEERKVVSSLPSDVWPVKNQQEKNTVNSHVPVEKLRQHFGSDLTKKMSTSKKEVVSVTPGSNRSDQGSNAYDQGC